MPAVFAIGAQLASSRGLGFTAGNGAMSAWQELTASLSQDIDGFHVCALGQNNYPFLVEIGTGAAASETVLVPNVPILGSNVSRQPILLNVPIPIAAGTRIVCRGQAPAASQGLEVALVGYEDSAVTFTGIERIDDATVEHAKALTVSGSTHTEAAWTQLQVSTARAYDAVAVVISNNNAYPTTNRVGLIDLATGAAGSEVAVVEDLLAGHGRSGFESLFSHYGPMLVPIASGARVAARIRQSQTTAAWSLGLFGLWGASYAGGPTPLRPALAL